MQRNECKNFCSCQEGGGYNFVVDLLSNEIDRKDVHRENRSKKGAELPKQSWTSSVSDH